jgi:hypothetical protein
MISKRSGRIIATVVTLFSFLAVTYVSCKKSTQEYVRCENVICENGGYCALDSTRPEKHRCNCPIGFEGANCGIASAKKYFGTWDMHQKILGSDSLAYKGKDTTYVVFLQQTATPTTFFINNFFNDPYYNYITCTLDSTDSYKFVIDSISAFHMVYDHYKIQDGGYGNFIRPADTSIFGTFVIRFKNKTTNWQIDTVTFTLTPHHL